MEKLSVKRIPITLHIVTRIVEKCPPNKIRKQLKREAEVSLDTLH